jgi:hypothetical protein
MAFFSNKTDPRINPDWQQDYWKAHPRGSEFNETFVVDYSNVGNPPSSIDEQEANYSAF